MEKAPLYKDIISDPCDAQAFWLRTEDGIRIRIAIWSGGNKGTVFILTGRTEYIEKYASIANLLYQGGYSVVTHDWRGQGLSDRLLANPNIGYIGKFSDYQMDMNVVIETSKVLKLPQPFFLLSHSMGGCIGLRTIHQTQDFKSAVFTGPMWKLHGKIRMLLAKYISALAISLGFDKKLILGAEERNYLYLSTPEKNSLTSDPDIFLFLKNQIDSYPELNVGGPSWRWLKEAIKENDFMLSQSYPETPSLVILGSDETLVDVNEILSYCRNWPQIQLDIIPNTKHEVLMESERYRDLAMEKILSFYQS